MLSLMLAQPSYDRSQNFATKYEDFLTVATEVRVG